MEFLELESFIPHQLTPNEQQIERRFLNEMMLQQYHQHQQSQAHPHPSSSQPSSSSHFNSSPQSVPVYLPNFNDELNKKGTKRPHDESEDGDGDGDGDDSDKQKARRANQNLACRNYRRRKKEYVQELETKISSLENELDTLRKENANFKRGEAFESIDPNLLGMLAEMKQILEKLDEAVKSNADDKSIQYYIQLYFLSLEKRHPMINKEIDKLVNPLTQAKLATMGYVPSLEHPVVANISGPNGNEWWAVYAQEARVTEEQARSIKELREKHWRLDSELRVERNVLDKSIKDFFLQNLKLLPAGARDIHAKFKSGPGAAGLDMGEVIEFARQLNSLKKNFIAQRNLMMDITTQLNKVLTPRQHAILILRINTSRTFDWPRHVQTLRSAWQLFSEEKAT